MSDGTWTTYCDLAALTGDRTESGLPGDRSRSPANISTTSCFCDPLATTTNLPAGIVASVEQSNDHGGMKGILNTLVTVAAHRLTSRRVPWYTFVCIAPSIRSPGGSVDLPAMIVRTRMLMNRSTTPYGDNCVRHMSDSNGAGALRQSYVLKDANVMATRPRLGVAGG